MLQVDLTRPMLVKALDFAWTQKLRGADAIHLASAEAIQADFGQKSLVSAFLTADVELTRAAKASGVVVVDPTQTQ